MKVTNIFAHAISVPLDEPFYFSQGWVSHRSALIVEIETDAGITGWGECLCHGLQSPLIAATFIEQVFRPIIIGRTPFDVEVLWEEMYNITRPYGQGGSAVNAISGVDIALWDVIGKAVNKPIHSLIGGAFRTEIQPYATGFYRTKNGRYPEDSYTEAQTYLDKGFKAMKLKIGFGVEQDILLIKQLREAVGPNIRLMADANGAYSVGCARKIILETESAKPYFLEELLAPEDLEGYKQIRNISSTYIAAGEQLFGKRGYQPWLSQNALDILQPDLCSSGGITECKKIAALAQAHSTPLIPHVWGSGIGIAASLQFIASLPPSPLGLFPEEPMLEFDQSDHPFRKDLIADGIVMTDGMVQISQKPGIGVDVDRSVINRFKIN